MNKMYIVVDYNGTSLDLNLGDSNKLEYSLNLIDIKYNHE